MAMPPGNTPPGFPGTHQPNQLNQVNQLNQAAQLNQPAQLNQTAQLNPQKPLSQQTQLSQPNQLGQPTQLSQPNQLGQPTQLGPPIQMSPQVQLNQQGQLTQQKQVNIINQPNQLNHPNQSNQQFDIVYQMARNTASSPNLAQLNHGQPPNVQPQPPNAQLQQHNPHAKQQDRNMFNSILPPNGVGQAAALAALLNATKMSPQISSLLKKFAAGENLLRLQQLQSQAQQNNFQQRAKQNMPNMHLSQMQPGASLSTSVSTPTLSTLSSVSSAPGIGLNIQQPPNQTILTPRQQMNASKKQKEFPKVDVNVSSQSLLNCIESCGLSNAFLERIDKFEVSNNAKLSPKSVSTIAMALYLRMHHIIEQSVKNCHIRLNSHLYMTERQNFLEKQRNSEARENEPNQNRLVQSQLQQKMNQEFQRRALSFLPGEPVFTDIPLANIALIEAERRIINSGLTISPEPPKGIDTTFDVYRNQILCGIAARSSEQMREKITSYTKEIPDNVQPDLTKITGLGLVQSNDSLQVSFDDVYQVIERDIMFTPEKLLSPKFYLQTRKIANLKLRNKMNNE